MSASLKYVCPNRDCRAITIDVTRSVLAGITPKATCAVCGWSGELKECDTVFSSDKMYGVEELALHLNAIFIRGVAPTMMAEFQKVGLAPMRETVARVGWEVGDLQRYNALVDELRGLCLETISTAFLHTALNAFGAAHEALGKFETLAEIAAREAAPVRHPEPGHEPTEI